MDRRTAAACRYVYPGLFDDWVALRLLKPPFAPDACRLLGGLPAESLALLYFACDRREKGIVTTYLAHWRHVKPRLTGADIVDLGVRPGPAVGRMLEEVRRQKLRGRLLNKRSEVAFVRGRLKAF